MTTHLVTSSAASITTMDIFFDSMLTLKVINSYFKRHVNESYTHGHFMYHAERPSNSFHMKLPLVFHEIVLLIYVLFHYLRSPIQWSL